MKYDAKCPRCDEVQEYESPITDPDKNLPFCSACASGLGTDEAAPKMVRTFSREYGSGGFVLKGKGWFKDGY